MTQTGRVVASHGRHVVVEDSAGNRRICHPRGKKNQAVVGDWVLLMWCDQDADGNGYWLILDSGNVLGNRATPTFA